MRVIKKNSQTITVRSQYIVVIVLCLTAKDPRDISRVYNIRRYFNGCDKLFEM